MLAGERKGEPCPAGLGDMVERRGELRPGKPAPHLGGLGVLEVADAAGIGQAALGQHVPAIGLGVGRQLLDIAVEPGQSALQRRGIESRLLVFPNENHWVLKPANSLQWYETVLDWLDGHTKK